MSNEKVAEIVFKYYKSDDVQSAVDELIYEATKLWVEVNIISLLIFL